MTWVSREMLGSCRRASFTGCKRPSHGFTLLELLVVLAIIGLMTTIAALSIQRDPRDNLRETATLLRSDLLRLRSEAWRVNHVTTLELVAGGYSLHPDEIRRTLGRGLSISLTDHAGQKRDRIRFFPDGRASPARLSLHGPKGQIHVYVGWNSRVRVGGKNEMP